MARSKFEKKRIDNMQWSGVSSLSTFPSLPSDGKLPVLKTPLFYLASVSVDRYENEVYFINNTDEVLSFVAPFMLHKNLAAAGAKLGDTSADNVQKAQLYANDIDRLYTNVLPKQGVRIDRNHIVYDSDCLRQYFIHLPFKGLDSHYGIWHFNVVEKGGVSKSYPLLWDNFSKPTHTANSEYLFEKADIPIEPNVYQERCLLLERLTEAFGVADAIFVLAINDVLYRYCIGWGAPYNESDIQAKDIAHKCQKLKPKNVDAVKDIVQVVYEFWFGEGFAKNVSPQACGEILDLYKAHIAHKNML